MPETLEMLRETLPHLFELCQTIQEAARHGAEHPNTISAMRENVMAGIAAVETAASQCCPGQPITPTPMEAVHSMSGTQLATFADTWYTQTMGPKLLVRYQQLLQQQNQINEEHAKTIAHWILMYWPGDYTSRRTILLELGQRCAAWAPEYSWKLMCQIFDTMPPQEQIKQFPHWNGSIYQPGQHPQTELKVCPVCGGSGHPFHAAMTARMANYNPMFPPARLWMQCESCGNLYARYFPTEFLKLGAQTKVLQPTPDRMIIRQVNAVTLAVWCNILNKIKTYTPGMTLLEVGVGQGHLIAVAQELGYDVTAVELIESDAQETADLLGLPIICGDFLYLEEDRQFDIITMGDVIEHLQRPVDGLKKAYALLKNGGILWLSTPNFESSFSRMVKASDAMWCEPYHITYFSRHGLVPILEQIGFELLEYQVSNRYNGSMEMILRKK